MILKVKNIKRPIRITDYCAIHFPILGSRSAVKKAVFKGQLFLNDRRARDTDMLENGDVVKLKRPKQQKIKQVSVDLPILFQDDYLIVVNKPAGIAVNGNRNKTVENVVAKIAQKSHQADALPQPVAAHRIDVPTKGLVVLAKTKAALIGLNKAFQNGQVQKNYFAVVHGKTPESGRIEEPIKGKSAITEFERLQVAPSFLFKYFSLLQLKLITGRTHQLRIHLKDKGHLIVGDKEYARGQRTILGKGLFLCSCQLSFVHPIINKQVTFEIEPPARFRKLMDREARRFQLKK